jgi:KUP system potassium uptake protein
VVARIGFMDSPDVAEILDQCAEQGLEVGVNETTFFLSRERLLTDAQTTFGRLRGQLFAFMSRNAQPATAFFGLPPNRVVELGMQVEL